VGVCDAYLAHADLLRMLLSSQCAYLPSIADLVKPDKARRLRDRLIDDDKMDLVGRPFVPSWPLLAPCSCRPGPCWHRVRGGGWLVLPSGCWLLCRQRVAGVGPLCCGACGAGAKVELLVAPMCCWLQI
jgi:hypothetical protein